MRGGRGGQDSTGRELRLSFARHSKRSAARVHGASRGAQQRAGWERVVREWRCFGEEINRRRGDDAAGIFAPGGEKPHGGLGSSPLAPDAELRGVQKRWYIWMTSNCMLLCMRESAQGHGDAGVPRGSELPPGSTVGTAPRGGRSPKRAGLPRPCRTPLPPPAMRARCMNPGSAPGASHARCTGAYKRGGVGYKTRGPFQTSRFYKLNDLIRQYTRRSLPCRRDLALVGLLALHASLTRGFLPRRAFCSYASALVLQLPLRRLTAKRPT